ncbi:MAG: hypothetical protein JWN30_2882 [Bacilli bacterium]|nr:hypothetical protein [Bacilli bacterium]
MKRHEVGKHELVGSRQDSKFHNQKQLRLGEEFENVSPLGGDASMDDRIDDNDAENNLEFREHYEQVLGFPFMHPQHDATLDSQLDADVARKNGIID